MSSSPSGQFLPEVFLFLSRGGGRPNVVLPILPVFAGGVFVSSSGRGYCTRLQIIKSIYNILQKKKKKKNRLFTKIIKHYTYRIDMIIT